MTTPSPIIQIENLHKHYGETAALNGVSLNVYPGEVVLIIGPSGSGKSTLLRCINRLETFQAGSVCVDDIPLTTAENINAIRTEVGMVFQSFNLFPHLTVLENVTIAQKVVRKRSPEEAEEIGRALLAKVGIPEKENDYPGQLSGGQQQRVAIARALAMNQEVLDVMLQLAKEGMTMVVVSHEMGFARAAADRAVLMDEGLIVEEAVPDVLFSNPTQDRTKAFLSKIL